MNFVFTKYNLFIGPQVYRHGSVVKTYLTSYRTRAKTPSVTSISAYFDFTRVADTIDTQKSQDCDVTDKLPLVTTKVLGMQSQLLYFHTGAPYKRDCFQILDQKIPVLLLKNEQILYYTMEYAFKCLTLKQMQ
jgi:hypothetical protein